jgi:hypothetical protein
MSTLMAVTSAWTAAPLGTHIFSPEEVTGLLIHQANHMETMNNHLDAMQAKIVMIHNFILGGQRVSQPATTRSVLPTSMQPTLSAPVTPDFRRGTKCMSYVRQDQFTHI